MRNDMVDLLNCAEDFRQFAEKIITELRHYAPILREVLEDTLDTNAEMTVRHIKKLESLGLSHEEALLLTINSRLAIEEVSRRGGAKK